MTRLLLFIVGCAGAQAVAGSVVVPVVAKPVFPVMGEPPAGCLSRTEGSSSVGECASDSQCAAGGCSHEVCVTATLAPELVTTCDVLACFAELDVCGCHAGVCSWTLKGSAK